MHNMSQTLDLSSAPAILFLFGLSGSGKSYVGNLIGELTGCYVYHADDDITDEMILALQEKRPFTNEMRDRYFPIITEKILHLRQHHNFLVVTQAVYKQRHREYLCKNIPNMEMIFIDASDAVISQRLTTRNGGITGASALALRRDFEQPDSNIKVILNEGDKSMLVTQLNNYFSSAQPEKD